MGVPVSPRNIFPSNIQGLPTWYEVRVSEKGHLGRRGGVDLMVAMNPQTWDADLKEIEPGGYLFYDSTKPLPSSKFRDDVHVIGVPLTEICNRDLHRSAPAPAVQEHHLRRRAVGAARDRRRRDREASRRAVQGQGEAARREHGGAAPRPRLRAAEPRAPARHPRAARPTRSAIASSSTATPQPRSAASTAARRSARGIRSRRRPRLPRRSRSTARSCASIPRPASTATRSCRPRTRSRRSA